jgi:hypothetical protein
LKFSNELECYRNDNILRIESIFVG